VGGHLIGFSSGSLFALIPHPNQLLLVLACSLAVGSSMALMVLTRTHHPPASGTALGAALSGFSTRLALGVLVGALILSLAHYALGEKLVDL
ncbi:HPP family protein, partial [Candidatus Bathyarchaeota archaeon]